MNTRMRIFLCIFILTNALLLIPAGIKYAWGYWVLLGANAIVGGCLTYQLIASRIQQVIDKRAEKRAIELVSKRKEEKR